MKELTVRQCLDLYTRRKDMQERGITNPSEQIKKFTREIVQKLKTLPLDEEIVLIDDSFFDSIGNLIIKLPIEEFDITTKQINYGFVRTQMPESRKADFHLGCLGGSVFIDFNRSGDNLISLVRISFDGYGCCNLDNKTKSLSPELSKQFLIEIAKDELDQDMLTILVKEIIKINKENFWMDALEEYKLIDKN